MKTYDIFTITEEQIRNELALCTKPNTYYSHPYFPNYKYSNGVELALTLNMLDEFIMEIFTYCARCHEEKVITIKLFKNKGEENCIKIYSGANNKLLHTQNDDFTICKMNNSICFLDSKQITVPALKFYFSNKTLLLESEYSS